MRFGFICVVRVRVDGRRDGCMDGWIEGGRDGGRDGGREREGREEKACQALGIVIIACQRILVFLCAPVRTQLSGAATTAHWMVYAWR